MRNQEVNPECEDHFQIFLRESGLSVRAVHVLHRDFDSLGSLLDYYVSGKSFDALRHIGKKTADEINKFCEELLKSSGHEVFSGLVFSSRKMQEQFLLLPARCKSIILANFGSLDAALTYYQHGGRFIEMDACREEDMSMLEGFFKNAENVLNGLGLRNNGLTSTQFLSVKECNLFDFLKLGGNIGKGDDKFLLDIFNMFHDVSVLSIIGNSFDSFDQFIQKWRSDKTLMYKNGIGKKRRHEIIKIYGSLVRLKSTKIRCKSQSDTGFGNDIVQRSATAWVKNSSPSRTVGSLRRIVEGIASCLKEQYEILKETNVIVVNENDYEDLLEAWPILLVLASIYSQMPERDLDEILVAIAEKTLDILYMFNRLLAVLRLQPLEMQILCHRIITSRNSKRMSLHELGVMLGMSRERVRQLSVRVKKRLNIYVRLLALSAKLDPCFAPLLLVHDVKTVDVVSVAEDILSKSRADLSLDFCKSFVSEVLGLEWGLIDYRGDPNKKLLVKSSNGGLKAEITQLLTRIEVRHDSSANVLYFESRDQMLKHFSIEEKRLQEDDLQIALASILNTIFHFIETEEGCVLLISREKSRLPDFVVGVLILAHKPLSAHDIVNNLEEKFGISSTKNAIRRAVFRDDRLLALGKSGAYALKAWTEMPNGIVAGTVCDLVEDLLKREKLPLHIDEICIYVKQQGRAGNKGHIYTMLRTDHKGRFVLVGSGYFALRSSG